MTELPEDRLIEELHIARRSLPSAEALARYRALFSLVEKQPGGVAGALQRLVAHLAWDSRRQPAWGGVRGGAEASYRLLFSSKGGDVELMVEPVRGRRRIEGDLLAAGAAQPLAPALVQLAGEQNYETESAESGRFGFEGVEPGVYALTVIPLEGAVLEIEAVEIT